MTRGGWAMARVNMFLKMKRGGKVKDSYRKADQDISKSSYTYLDEDGEIEFSLEDQMEAEIDLKNYDLTEENEEDFEDIFDEESDSELTKKQKTLPPALQKKILEKKKQGKDSKKENKEDSKKEDPSEESEAKKGLWENIRDKKRRMGKNYKAAKPGDKDYPDSKALKKAQESSKKKKI